MSRIGKQIINIPEGVEIQVNGSFVTVKGPKGELFHILPQNVMLNVEGGQGRITIANPEDRLQNMLWGTNTSLVINMVKGVSLGFEKQLEVNGVGYKIELIDKKLKLNLGYSHPIIINMPDGIDVKVEKNVITINGIDKQLVGQVSAQIRAFRPPEPYKGKGIKYSDEIIRRKVGKAAASGE